MSLILSYLQTNSLLTTDNATLRMICDLPPSEFEELIYHLLMSANDDAKINGCFLCILYPNVEREDVLIRSTISINDPSRTIEGVVALFQIRSPETIALKFIDCLEKPDVTDDEIIGVETALYFLGITAASLSNHSRFYYLLTIVSWILSIVQQLNHDANSHHMYIPDLEPLGDQIADVDQYPYLTIRRELLIPSWEIANGVSQVILERIIKLFSRTTRIQIQRTCVALLCHYDFSALPTQFQQQIVTIYRFAQKSSDEDLMRLVRTPFQQKLINANDI